jgi:hypothetical protein
MTDVIISSLKSSETRVNTLFKVSTIVFSPYLLLFDRGSWSSSTPSSGKASHLHEE